MLPVADYLSTLGRLTAAATASDREGRPLTAGEFVDRAVDVLRAAKAAGGKLMLVGNGGSASIASHMTVDFAKNAGIPALAFNDGVMMSALGNDLGYDQVFARAIAIYGRPGDVVIAISSSGNSDNVVQAVAAGRAVGATVFTMSGFRPDNRLRRLGDCNLYVPSLEYGFVEIAHLAYCHAIVDLVMGWTPAEGLWSRQASMKGAA